MSPQWPVQKGRIRNVLYHGQMHTMEVAPLEESQIEVPLQGENPQTFTLAVWYSRDKTAKDILEKIAPLSKCIHYAHLYQIEARQRGRIPSLDFHVNCWPEVEQSQANQSENHNF